MNAICIEGTKHKCEEKREKESKQVFNWRGISLPCSRDGTSTVTYQTTAREYLSLVTSCLWISVGRCAYCVCVVMVL